MRYSRKDLLQLKDYHLEIDDKLTFDGDISTICPRIRAINEIYVKGDGYYDPESQRLNIHLQLTGSIVVGCDVTSEDVILDIDSDSDEVFTFDKGEKDIAIIKSEGEYINLLPTIFQLIVMDIPLKVVKPGVIDYPEGDGWEVISEETYQKEKKRNIDPRLSILKDYKPQDE